MLRQQNILKCSIAISMQVAFARDVNDFNDLKHPGIFKFPQEMKQDCRKS